MNPRRLTRAWIGLIFLVLGLALFPKGVKDAVLRTQGTQKGSAIAPALGALVGGAGLFIAGLIFWRVGREIWVLRTGVSARATITSVERDPGGRWTFGYAYRDRQGVAHQDRITLDDESWTKGDGAEVRYAANAPAKSMIVEPPWGSKPTRLPAVDTSLLDTPRVPTPPPPMAPQPARASLKTSIAFLVRFAAIILLAALATGALLLSFIWYDLIVQHGYWGAIRLIGEWKVLLALALTTAVVAIPIGAVLAILGVLIGGFYAFARHALKK